MAKPPIKRLGRKRRGNNVVKILNKVKKTLPLSPLSTHLVLPVGLVFVIIIFFRSIVSTIIRKVTI